MTTDTPIGVITISRLAIASERAMLQEMLENPEKDASRDNIRGQLGMLKKIERGDFPSRRSALPDKVPEDEARPGLYQVE